MATTERMNDKVAKWLWWVLVGSSLVFTLSIWWATKPTKERNNTASQTLSVDPVAIATNVMTLKVPVEGLRNGEKMVYEPIPIPAGGWGQEIENPHIDGHKLIWTPIGLDKEDCEVSINRELDRIYPCDVTIDRNVRTFQFRSKSGKRFEIEIELQKKTIIN